MFYKGHLPGSPDIPGSPDPPFFPSIPSKPGVPLSPGCPINPIRPLNVYESRMSLQLLSGAEHHQNKNCMNFSLYLGLLKNHAFLLSQ